MKVAILAFAAWAIVLNAQAAEREAAASADFAAGTGATLEEQLRQRLRERVRTVPGTDTQYLVGGYLQLDGIATRRKQEGDEQNTFFASAVPFGSANADYRLSVRQSQFHWLSRTPTGIGPLWTRLQANLFPLDGTTGLELNQLVVRLDDRLTIGKTYSTFMDDGALPTTLDYNGPGGVTFVRQWLGRIRVPLGSGWALEGAVEEPQADLAVGGEALSVETRSNRPDLAARVRFESDHGHLQIAGLSRRINVDVTTPFGSARQRVEGTGASVSGSISLLRDDSLLFQAVSGKGVGRYFNDPLSATGVALDPGGSLQRIRTSGATLYYQRKWAENWMTVAGASTLWVTDGGVRAPDSLKRSVYASANVIHRLTPTLVVGAEALWGEAERVDGDTATNLRLQLSVRYLLF